MTQISRLSLAVGALLVVAGSLAGYFAVAAPEIGLAWTRVSDACSQAGVVRECLDLVRTLNILRVRTWLVAACFVLAGALAALSCGLLPAFCNQPAQTGNRLDSRRVILLAIVALDVVAASLLVGGLVVALSLR